jgi:hypothetical protein
MHLVQGCFIEKTLRGASSPRLKSGASAPQNLVNGYDLYPEKRKDNSKPLNQSFPFWYPSGEESDPQG